MGGVRHRDQPGSGTCCALLSLRGPGGGVGGLCVTVTPPLSPGSHPEHAEPLLLARHQGRRAGGHLETSKRLHPDPGTRVQPGDELERVIGGRGGAQRAVSPPQHRPQPPRLCRSSWHWSEPNGGRRENCAVVRTDGMWYDYPCSSELPWVCEGQPWACEGNP